MHRSTVVGLGPFGNDVVQSVQGGEEIKNVIGDFFTTLNTVVCFIIERIDFISPLSIQGRCMENFCVCISLSNPRDSRLHFPNIFFTKKERVIFTEELLFEILDSIKSSQDSFVLVKNVPKDSGVPMGCLHLEKFNSLQEALVGIEARVN